MNNREILFMIKGIGVNIDLLVFVIYKRSDWCYVIRVRKMMEILVKDKLGELVGFGLWKVF